ncbi:MAG: hypothetical protein HC886_21340 [Leptolyngbyaceae cyanobacterium SM1_1_3]|nr:hypothetical protein [Leptolyngbyaceae cyanobacterium SM1_1_3]
MTPVDSAQALILPPEEVSRMCVYLASDQGRDVSGTRYFFESQMFSGFRD